MKQDIVLKMEVFYRQLMITTRGKTVISLFTELLAELLFQQNTLIHSLLDISGGVLVFSGLFCFWETEREQGHLCCVCPGKWNGQNTKQIRAICPDSEALCIVLGNMNSRWKKITIIVRIITRCFSSFRFHSCSLRVLFFSCVFRNKSDAKYNSHSFGF